MRYRVEHEGIKRRVWELSHHELEQAVRAYVHEANIGADYLMARDMTIEFHDDEHGYTQATATWEKRTPVEDPAPAASEKEKP